MTMNPTLHDQLRQWRKAHMKEEKRKQEDKKCNEKKENRYQKPPKRHVLKSFLHVTFWI